MKIVFNDIFYQAGYTNDAAAVSGRMEVITAEIKKNSQYHIINGDKAGDSELLMCHTAEYIESVKQKQNVYEMALYAAGCTIHAAQRASTGEPAFALVRPPGHHAHANMAWGHCFFNNMALAIKSILKAGNLQNIFILDFDAHTGDGTRDLLKDYKNVKILNPSAENSEKYIKEVKDYIADLHDIELIAVCAGFDSYEKDVGKKLRTFDYYHIGNILSDFAKKCGHKRKFAVLEGGYYLPDLGKNVVSFCDGFLR